MDGRSASSRRMSIGVVGRGGGGPPPPVHNDDNTNSGFRRQTIAPTIKDHTAVQSKKIGEVDAGLSLEPKLHDGFHPAAAANRSRSSLLSLDHSSASLNTSYVSSSSSDHSTERLDMSDEVSDQHSNYLPAALLLEQPTKTLPSRPPLADHRPRRQTITAAVTQREDLAFMRRDRRRSTAPRIGQGSENESSTTKSSTTSNANVLPHGKSPMMDIVAEVDEDVTEKLSLPTHSIQDIMNQASLDQSTELSDDPPPRQSLPFDDAMDDPPKVKRTTSLFMGYASRKYDDEQSGVEGADALDVTADSNDIQSLFGFGASPESTDKATLTGRPSQADGGGNNIESTAQSGHVSASLHEKSMRSPARKKAANEATVDSPARNTRSSRKPLTGPLEMSPRRSTTKSPARIKNLLQEDGKQHDEKSGPNSSSPPLTVNAAVSSLRASVTENAREDKIDTQNDSVTPSLNDKSEIRSHTNKPSSGQLVGRSHSRHSLPLRSAQASNAKGRAKSMTPTLATQQEKRPSSDEKWNNDRTDGPSEEQDEALSQQSGTAIATEQPNASPDDKLNFSQPSSEMQSARSPIASLGIGTSSLDMVHTTDTGVDSLVQPLAADMHDIVDVFHTQEIAPVACGGPVFHHLDNKSHTDFDMDIEGSQPTEGLESDNMDFVLHDTEEKGDVPATNIGTHSGQLISISAKIGSDGFNFTPMFVQATPMQSSARKLNGSGVGAGICSITEEGLSKQASGALTADHPEAEQQEWDGSLLSIPTLPWSVEGSPATTLTTPSSMVPFVSNQESSENVTLPSTVQVPWKPGRRSMTAHGIARHPPRSSITPTKLSGAPARLANPLTAPTSDFKRNRSLTPSKSFLSLNKRASYDHVPSDFKRLRTASGLKPALRSATKNSNKAKKVVAFGAPESLEFDPAFAALTPVQGDSQGRRTYIDVDEKNIDAGRTPFPHTDDATINLGEKLQTHDEFSDSVEGSPHYDNTAVLEKGMNQLLDLDHEFLPGQANSSSSSMDTTVDSSPDTSPEEFFVGNRSARRSSIPASSLQYSMIPETSYVLQAFESISNECSISIDAKVDDPALPIDLTLGEIVSSDIRDAARRQRRHDVLWRFLNVVKAFSDSHALKDLLENIMDAASGEMPTPIDYGHSLCETAGDEVEALLALQKKIRHTPGSTAPELKHRFDTIQANEIAAWCTWILESGKHLETVLSDRINRLANRSNEIVSLTQKIDEGTTSVVKAFSWSKRAAMEEKTNVISSMSDELQELEAKLDRLSSTQKGILQERSHLDRMFEHIKTQIDNADNEPSEGECVECMNRFDVAAGLCKWRIRTIKEERWALDYIGQTSETYTRLSFDMSTSPIQYSIDLERNLFPAERRFASKISKTVSTLLNYRMKVLQESHGRQALDSFSSVPELVRYLALELVQIDVLAMEIKAIEQRHAVTIDFAYSGNVRVTACFPNKDEDKIVAVSFLVSREYPIAPPSPTIHPFDESLDMSTLLKLIKKAKPGFGGMLHTFDSVKAFCVGC